MSHNLLYRCGWCGHPTSKDGEPLKMSQTGLQKDIHLWDNAELVNGKCCEDYIRNQEQYEYEILREIYRD